jgi:hypothetical protein
MKKMSELKKGLGNVSSKKSLKELVSPWTDGAGMNTERWVAAFGLYNGKK